MSWIEIKDYRAGGWEPNTNADARSFHYCRQLEQGQILFFPQPPFQLPLEDSSYLISQPQTDSRLHKNISYRPETDLLRGFGGGREDEKRVRGIMRSYSSQVTEFVSTFLAPYANKLQRDYASFRPLEEEGRDLPLHKRNDLLHVDAFPSRPTCGGRILRVFTNLNPSKGRLWLTGQRFPALAERYAKPAGLETIVASGTRRGVMHALHAVGLPVADRSAYDEFMLHFHDYLKENTEFQQSRDKERIEFPPLATWLVFTDGVPHAALSGQYAMEQTFIVPAGALVSREDAPIAVLERICGRKMA
ncbi:MAG: Kdo hydroxylase family protein [Acidobacteriia bacterium]|nr:Kdo hydroxylase family protein [Terriglobia bacterium]